MWWDGEGEEEMSSPTVRVVTLVSVTSGTTTTQAFDLDYREDGDPSRHLWVSSVSTASGQINVEAGPTSDGPWATFASVAATVSGTSLITFVASYPFIRVVKSATSGSLSIIGVI